MEKKGKKSREKRFSSILIGLNIEGKEMKNWIFVWIGKGKERKEKNSKLNY